MDLDFADIEVTLSAAATVYGVGVPTGTKLTFPNRMVEFPGLTLTPRLLLALPWLWWNQRRQARVIEAVIDRDASIAGRQLAAGSRIEIHPDGRTQDPPQVRR